MMFKIENLVRSYNAALYDGCNYSGFNFIRAFVYKVEDRVIFYLPSKFLGVKSGSIFPRSDSENTATQTTRVNVSFKIEVDSDSIYERVFRSIGENTFSQHCRMHQIHSPISSENIHSTIYKEKKIW